MTRLTTRLVVSHLLVVVIGAVVTYGVVRVLAPPLFDNQMHGLGPMGGGGPGQGPVLRQQFAAAVNEALLIGALVGAVAAASAGLVIAVRLVRPITGLRDAARALAAGRYRTPMPMPGTQELAGLAGDLEILGATLADTESRRLALLGEVAHEMRTPLTVIDGYVEGMIDGVLPTTSAELGQVSAEVRRLRRLAEDLSALSRADEGRLRLEPEDVDLRDVVGAAAERLRAQVEANGIALTIDPGADPLVVHADPDRLGQVVTNVVGNALRATAAGGTIAVASRRGGSVAIVDVTDTGEGIASTDLERIFERFYRVAGRRVVEGESGHGIGLTIARSLTRAHGGDLTASSPGPGHGATFRLTIPLHVSESAAPR